MPKVTEEYRNNRRETITRAAAGCFARKGVQQTSMADIIAASGLSAGAIYNHFRSKEAIIVATAVGVIKDRMLVVVEADPDDQLSPADLFGTAIGVLKRATVDDEKPITGLLIQFWGEAVVNPKLLAMMQEEMQVIRGTLLDPVRRWARRQHGLSAARASRWAERTSQVLISLVVGFVVQREIFPGFDERSYVAEAERALQALTPQA